jgi:hypothetical protein
LEINTNRLVSGGGLSDGVLYTADVTYSSADYIAKITAVTADSGDDPSILAVRIQDSSNMYAVKFNNTDCQLYKKTLGTWSTVGTAGAGVVDGSVVELKIEGTTLTFYDDGVSIKSATVSDHSSAGKAGVGMGAVITSGDDMSAQTLDTFEVNTLASSSTVTVTPSAQTIPTSSPSVTVATVRNVSTEANAQAVPATSPSVTIAAVQNISTSVNAHDIPSNSPSATVSTPATIADASTFTDDFNDNSTAPTWTNGNIDKVIETNQRLEMTSTAGGGYYGYTSTDQYNIIGSSAYTQLTVLGSTSITSLQAFPIQISNASGSAKWIVTNGGATAVYNSGLGDTTLTSVTHTDGNLYRIREASGTLYFDYSTTGGSSWTNAGSMTNFFAAPIFINIQIGTWQPEATTATVIFDNFNFSGTSIIVTPETQVVTTVSPIASVSTQQVVTVPTSAQAITTTSLAGTVTAQRTVTVSATAHEIPTVGPATTVSTTSAISVTPNAQAIPVTSPTPAITTTRSISIAVDPQAVTVSSPATTVTTQASASVEAPAQALTVGNPSATASGSTNVSVAAAAQALGVASPGASVATTRNINTVATAQEVITTSPIVAIIANRQVAAEAGAHQIAVGSSEASVATVRQLEVSAAVQEVLSASPDVTVLLGSTITPQAQSVAVSNPFATASTTSNASVLVEGQQVTVSSSAVSISTANDVDVAAIAQQVAVANPPVSVRGDARVTLGVSGTIFTSPEVEAIISYGRYLRGQTRFHRTGVLANSPGGAPYNRSEATHARGAPRYRAR